MAMTVALVGVLALLGTASANASPPGPDPYAWMPREVRPWLEPIFVFFANLPGLVLS